MSDNLALISFATEAAKLCIISDWKIHSGK